MLLAYYCHCRYTDNVYSNQQTVRLTVHGELSSVSIRSWSSLGLNLTYFSRCFGLQVNLTSCQIFLPCPRISPTSPNDTQQGSPALSRSWLDDKSTSPFMFHSDWLKGLFIKVRSELRLGVRWNSPSEREKSIKLTSSYFLGRVFVLLVNLFTKGGLLTSETNVTKWRASSIDWKSTKLPSQ